MREVFGRGGECQLNNEQVEYRTRNKEFRMLNEMIITSYFIIPCSLFDIALVVDPGRSFRLTADQAALCFLSCYPHPRDKGVAAKNFIT